MSAIAEIQPKLTTAIDPLLLCAAVEASAEGLAVTEAGRIAYANRAFERMFAETNGAGLLGRKLDELDPQCGADGGIPSSAYGAGRCTHDATDGTPLLLTMNSM